MRVIKCSGGSFLVIEGRRSTYLSIREATALIGVGRGLVRRVVREIRTPFVVGSATRLECDVYGVGPATIIRLFDLGLAEDRVSPGLVRATAEGLRVMAAIQQVASPEEMAA